MYRLSPKTPDGEVYSVIRINDWNIIPFDKNNTDYQKYLKWVAEGNEAEEWVVE